MSLLHKIEKALEPAVSNELSKYMDSREKIAEIKQQVKTQRNEAEKLSAKLPDLEEELRQALLDGKPPKPIKNKIAKNCEKADEHLQWADQLETDVLPELEKRVIKMKHDFDQVAGQAVKDVAKEQSKKAGQKFLEFVNVYMDWIDSVHSINQAFQTSFAPTTSHRLLIDDTVKQLTLEHRRLYHHVARNITSDFHIAGSHPGDL